MNATLVKVKKRGWGTMDNNVGKRIATLRKQKGWSQAELAAMLNVSDKSVSKWENGGMPGIDLFPKLAKLFNVTIDYLMIGDAEDEYCLDEENPVDAKDGDCLEEENPVATEVSDDFDVEAYSFEELKLILTDQQDLFTKSELAQLQARLDALCKERGIPVMRFPSKTQTPEKPKFYFKDEICPGCDMENEENNRFCKYCGYDFAELQKRKSDETSKNSGNEIGCWAYLIALLCPLAGVIIGVKYKDIAIAVFSVVVMILSFIILMNSASILDGMPSYYYNIKI